MKKIICQFCQWPFLRHSIITIVLVTAAGCSSAYYDPDTTAAATAAPRQADAGLGSFDNVDTRQSDSSQPQPTILRQGDVVKVSFPGSSNLNESEQIRLDGKISLPLVGDVQAAGLTPDQLQQNLIKLYAPQISASDVTVAIESSSFPIYVTGCVLSPGRVLSNQPITALEAVMEAGGFDYSRANLRKVHVVRRENDTSQSYVLNLKSVLKGEDKNDFFVQPNDIIYVPEKFSWF
ncbi:MAG TPA: polysaccharide biosynthesis/export family protein [Verrucomicrobiae bacterium]|jgi:polysaccharide export outer membrane protein